MSFEPKSGEHAIIEAVFSLTVRRPFNRSEIEAAANSHERWKSRLPRLSRNSVMQFVVGPEDGVPPPVNFPTPAGGVIFDRVKPDGELAWRLTVGEQTIAVNCLEYTRWADVWPQVESFLAEAVDVAALATNPVTSLSLQYIDIFEWRNRSKAYQLSELLDLESQMLPKHVGQHGPLWHLHQGWFRKDGLPVSGRLLERINFDGVTTIDGIPVVKIDTVYRIDLEKTVSGRDLFTKKHEGAKLFDYMHNAGKKLLSKFLTKEAAARIQLNASNK